MKLNLSKNICGLITVIFAVFFCLQVDAIENQTASIGIDLIKDKMRTFHNGTYVYNVSSPSVSVPIGSEIIKINDINIKKKSLTEIKQLIEGKEGTQVSLYVKKPDKTKQTYTLTRTVTTLPKKQVDERFDIHWKQVVPTDAEICDDIPNEVLQKLSYNYMSYLKYWSERKTLFTNGYNACLSYQPNEQNFCLMNLVNREIEKTKNDRYAEIQAMMAQQQAIYHHENMMNQIRTENELNNINNSIRNINNNLKK